MVEPAVLAVVVEDGVRRLDLNRPERSNALDHATIEALLTAFEEAERDHETRVLLLSGAGAGFCAGADLREAKNLTDGAGVAAHAERMKRLLLAPLLCPKPVVAAIHGFALGAGFGLALACDVVVCSETARLGFPEVKRGLLPALVAPVLLRRAGYAAAFDLLATGRRISPGDAARSGWLRAVPDEDLGDAARTVAEELAARPQETSGLKALLREIDELAPAAAFEVACRANVASKLRRLETGA